MHFPLRTAKGAEGVSICSLGLSLKVGTNVGKSTGEEELLYTVGMNIS